MLNKKTFITLAVLGLVLTAGIASTYAYQGNPAITGPNYSPERHEAMLKAFENKDYNSWKKLMGNRGPAKVIDNQDKFNKFVEARQAALAGDVNKARQLRVELGLGNGMGKANGKRMMRRGAGLGGNFIDQNHDGICDRLNLK